MWLWSILLGVSVVVGESNFHQNVSQISDAILGEAAKLPEESFYGDVRLKQSDERNGNGLTSFYLASDESGKSVIFERRVNKTYDYDPLLILSPKEDKLPSWGIKRRYVILRLAPTREPGIYEAFYAYLRDADPTLDQGLTRIGPQNEWVIEWDSWDYRGPGRERFATAGYSNCGPSALVPCGFKGSVKANAYAPEGDGHSDTSSSPLRPVNVKERWSPGGKKKGGFKSTLPRIKGESGFDVEEFYTDLNYPEPKDEPGTGILYGQDPKNIATKAPRRREKVPKWAGGNSGYFYHSSSTSISSSSSIKTTSTRGRGRGGVWVASTKSRDISVAKVSGKREELWGDPDSGGVDTRAEMSGLEMSDRKGSGTFWGSRGGPWSSISIQEVATRRSVQMTGVGGRWRGRRVKRGNDEEEKRRRKRKTTVVKVVERRKGKGAKDKDFDEAVDFMRGFRGGGGAGTSFMEPIKAFDGWRDEGTDKGKGQSRDNEQDEGRGQSQKGGHNDWLDKELKSGDGQRKQENLSTSVSAGRNRDKGVGGNAKASSARASGYLEEELSSEEKEENSSSSEEDDSSEEEDTSKSTNRKKNGEREPLARNKGQRQGQNKGQGQPTQHNPDLRGGGNSYQTREKDTIYQGRNREGLYEEDDHEGNRKLSHDRKQEALLHGRQRDNDYLIRGQEKVDHDRERASVNRGVDRSNTRVEKKDGESKLYYGRESDALLYGRDKEKVFLDDGKGEKVLQARDRDALVRGRDRENIYLEDTGESKLRPGKGQEVEGRGKDKEKTTTILEGNGGESKLLAEKEEGDLTLGKGQEGISPVNKGDGESRVLDIKEETAPGIRAQIKTVVVDKTQDEIGEKVLVEKEKDALYQGSGRERVLKENGKGGTLSLEKGAAVLAKGSEREKVLLENNGESSKLLAQRRKCALVLGKVREKTYATDGEGSQISRDRQRDVVYVGSERETLYREDNVNIGIGDDKNNGWITNNDKETLQLPPCVDQEGPPQKMKDPPLKKPVQVILTSPPPEVTPPLPEMTPTLPEMTPPPPEVTSPQPEMTPSPPELTSMTPPETTPEVLLTFPSPPEMGFTSTEPPPTPPSSQGRSSIRKTAPNASDLLSEQGFDPQTLPHPVKLTGNGSVIANSTTVSESAKTSATAVDKIGLGAVSTATNGSSAIAISMSKKDGDALATADTFGEGGSRSNALAKGTGVAISSAASRGVGDADANAVAKGSGAEAKAEAARGGHSKAESVSHKDGDAIASSIGRQGGGSSALATARGAGSALSESLAEGGGNSSAKADAKGGGSAMSNSQAGDGGASHSMASSRGNGSSWSTAGSTGGGVSVADANSEVEEETLGQDTSGEDETPFDPDLFADRVKTMPDATFKVINPQLGQGQGQDQGQSQSQSSSNKDSTPARTSEPVKDEPSSTEEVDVKGQEVVYLPGWKTQYSPRPLQPNCTLEHESDLFYGLGSCPRRSGADRDDGDLLPYYMALLRSYCLPKEVRTLKGLLKNGVLIQKGPLLQLNLSSPHMTQSKLTPGQLEELGRAFELHIFSLALNEGSSGSKSRSPGKGDVSRSVRFLVDLILKGVEVSRALARSHYIHLTRQLILVGKVAYTKLLQDWDALENGGCDGCGLDKGLNFIDRTEIFALVEWLLKGLGPLDKGVEGAEESFKKFFDVNFAGIVTRVGSNFGN